MDSFGSDHRPPVALGDLIADSFVGPAGGVVRGTDNSPVLAAATTPDQMREDLASVDQPTTLRGAVFHAIGAASVCWIGRCPPGTFDALQATKVAEGLLEFITSHQSAQLGLATTRELLAELTARIEVDHSAGGGGLDYSTVGGRP